eukprot:scaffold87983_cov75-Phaeocystis_antarctica.AAC.3
MPGTKLPTGLGQWTLQRARPARLEIAPCARAPSLCCQLQSELLEPRCRQTRALRQPHTPPAVHTHQGNSAIVPVIQWLDGFGNDTIKKPDPSLTAGNETGEEQQPPADAIAAERIR